MKIVVTALIVVLVSVSVVSWAWFQGVFDAPRVRMIRMATAMDTQALRVARVIEKGVSAASESLIFAAAQTEFDIAYGNRSVTLAWYLIDQRAFVDPRHAYFDWKEDSETVAPAFDEMLNSFGVSERPDKGLLLRHEAEYAAEFSAMPIIVSHYVPIFERNGLSLMTLDADWDAYYFFVVKKSTAFLWRNVRIFEPDANARLDIARILPHRRDLANTTDLKAVFSAALNADQQTEVPWRSGH